MNFPHFFSRKKIQLKFIVHKIILMNILEYIDQMKSMQQNLLDFLDNEKDTEEYFQNIAQMLADKQITSNRHKLKAFLHMLTQISNNHHRHIDFFEKIDKILFTIKDDISKIYSNSEIFDIFESNKRLLLFFVEEKLLNIDTSIKTKMMQKSTDYFPYLLPERYLNAGNIPENTESRKLGENTDIVASMIRQDLIEEFITYVKKQNYSLQNFIKATYYETNNFLLKRNKVTLIEYAAFFGSSQIFKYLYQNEVELTSSLWLFAVHGDDAEIIKILEEKSVQPPSNSYYECIKEAIKCHHNNIVNYIQNNFLDENLIKIDFENKFDNNVAAYCFHYYNLFYLPNDIDWKYVLYYACHYDHFEIVDCLLNTKKIDINSNRQILT